MTESRLVNRMRLVVVALLACVFFPSASYAWFNPGWVYRQEITILPTLADSNLSGFPYLVKITDGSNPVFANSLSNGDDIVFTSSDGSTKLAHELEKYDSTSNELYAWVRVPTVSSTANTVIYMYYGNGSVTASEEDVEGTWDSDFVDVQHLQETAGTHFDSTSNNNDATPLNGVNQNATGQIDGANQFDGSNDKVDTADSASLRVVDMTVEAWVYVPSSIPSGFDGIVVHAPSTSNWYGLWKNDNRFHFRWSTGSVRRTDFNATFSPNQWYYVAGVLDVGADRVFTYQNDVLDTTIVGPSAPTPTAGPLYIGHTFSGSEFFPGFIDEVRISRIARSDAWIKASARNQGTPDTYQTLGSEESVPVAGGANLGLTNADSPDPLSVGSTITYSLTATNNGPDGATNVTLVDTLPAAVDWQSATPSQGSCVHSGEPLGGTVTCTLGTIANGANATVDIDVVAPGTAGVISNSATVSADEADPDASDNTATEDTTVVDPAVDCSLGVVTTTTDSVTGSALRACIIWANGNPGADTITVPAGTYSLTRNGNDDDAFEGDLDITEDLTIIGAGAGSTTIDGNGTIVDDRVFDVLAGVTAAISGVTIRDGDIGGGDGGGIRNQGNLTLTNVTVRDNIAGTGGGVFSEGATSVLTFTNTTITGNTAGNGGGIYIKDAGSELTMTGGSITNHTNDGEGGGIRNERGDVTLTNVNISNNTAKNGGGVWSKEVEATLDVTNSTFSQNTSNDDGGAIFNEKGAITINNADFDDNTGIRAGGAIWLRQSTGTVTITDSTFSSNQTTNDDGGAIYSNENTVDIVRTTFDDNTGNRDGGALYSTNGNSNVTITDSTFSSNQTNTQDGGAIRLEGGTLTINRATLNANNAARDGGGLWVKDAIATLTNVTISGNSAPGDEGGGVRVEKGTVQLNNVTLTGNSAGSGGGIFVESDPVILFNTIVANSASGGNCSGSITSLGTNLDSANTCALGGTGDLTNSNPDLGSLQNNGGPTLTHALSTGSPAIDAGNNTGCPATDQRGVARPIDGDVDTIAVCDIGAYEAPPAISAALALSMTDSDDPVSISSAFDYTLTVTNNGPDDASNVTLIDTLPADIDWQSATPSQGSCVHSGESLGGTVTCTFGTITNAANATVTIGVVAPNTTGVINNSATVSADEPDPDASDNTAVEDTTIIDPSANLNVTQVEDFDPAGVNLPFVYTVTVTNAGPTDATLVTLVDTLDSAVTYQTAVPSQGSCGEAGGIVTCDLGALANGSSATIDVTVTAPPTPQTVTNTAVVSAAEPDSDLSDNTSLEDTDVINPPPADLSLTKIVTPDPALAGNPVTYTLTISNLGPGPATLVQLIDTLPATATFVSATPSSGSCSQTGGPPGGTVDCAMGTIAAGASRNVVIVVTAPAIPGVLTNSASVSTARIDPNPANDIASVDTVVTVPGEADLALSKSDSPDPVLVNQTLSYSLVVDNLGPDDATAVVLVDTLPAAVTFQSAISSQGSCSESGGTVTCDLGDILDAASATVDIIVTAPSSAGSITNNASVSAGSDDLDPANDNASETTTVQNLNVNQLCYLVADAGGGGGGNDLLTQIDTADFSALTNETNIGVGTGTNSIEAIAWNSATGVLYGANAGQLGTLSTTTGVFTALPSPFGTGNHPTLGAVAFTDVDGLTYDSTNSILYGVERQSGTDVLIQINMATGAHVPNAFGAGLDYVPLPPIGTNTITDDIAVDPTTGIMYAAVNAGGSTDRLIRINKATGATTDVALITVPDIEGLGTDPTGQLWGTSGTQGILYELNKVTGVGSNGRPIDNGSDYESIDCHAFSPSVVADLGVAKTVDNAAPPEGGTVTYTVTVTNAGPSTATVVQLSDALPAGVTFVSAIPGQGTYNGTTGDWFVGTLGVGSNATLTLQASVDAATAGTTITNTAGVTYLSQNDPNAGNASASVDITPVTANLTVIKSVSTVRDPLGATAPAALSIPGAVVQYEISITNSGNGSATEVIVTDTLNANLTFLAGEYDGGAADIEIIVGAASPVYCIAEVSGDTNADGCFLNAAGDDLTVTIPVSATYPTGLTVGTTAPDNVAVVHFRVTVN